MKPETIFIVLDVDEDGDITDLMPFGHQDAAIKAAEGIAEQIISEFDLDMEVEDVINNDLLGCTRTKRGIHWSEYVIDWSE
jgi:hypothetical protein